MALPDLTGQNIEDTYPRLLQTDSGIIYDGTGSLISNLDISSSYAEIADTASFAQSGDGTFSGSFSGSFQGDGSQLTTNFTTASIVYSGSNVTQVTQSFGSTEQITNIVYSGSFADGNPLSIAVTGSNGLNTLYTLTYSASLVTQIIQS